LITESDGGRILEVTRHRKTVWEFVNPVRSGEENDRVAVVCSAERYDPTKLNFLSPLNVAQVPPNEPNAKAENTKRTAR